MRLVVAACALALAALAGCDDCPAVLSYEEINEVEIQVRTELQSVAVTLADCRSDNECINQYVDADCIQGCCVPINRANVARYLVEQAKTATKYCPGGGSSCPQMMSTGDCWCSEVRCDNGKCIIPH